MWCKVYRECKPQALSYVRGGWRLKPRGGYPQDMGKIFSSRCGRFGIFPSAHVWGYPAQKHGWTNNERCGEGFDGGLHDRMARDGLTIKCISGNDTCKLRLSTSFQRRLEDRGYTWRGVLPRTPQSNVIGSQNRKHQSLSELTAIVHDVRHAFVFRDILRNMGFPEGRLPWFCHNRRSTQAASKVGVGARRKRVYIKLKSNR